MDDSPRPAAARPRAVWLPPPALCGFLLLALMFAASYAVGDAAGPVAPGIHRTGTAPGDGTGSGGSGGGGAPDMEGM